MSGQQLALDGGNPVRRRPWPDPLHGVLDVGEEEIDAVVRVLRSKALFRYAQPDECSEVAGLERDFQAWTGCPFALALGGGTAGLVCALAGIGISPGDEVIVPAYTYIATPAAVLLNGGIPVIAEVDDTLTLDPRDLERKITPLTRAVIPVHMKGVPAAMDRITAIASSHGIAVIEDVAQAAGGFFRGRPLGSWGEAAAFSFQYYKVMTTGEGGMLVTAHRRVYERACFRHDSAAFFWGGKQREPSFFGANYRMDEMRGAIGRVQFRRMRGILARTRGIKRRLTQRFAGAAGVRLQRVHDAEGDCGLAFNLQFGTPAEAQRFAECLSAEGLPAQTIFNRGIPDRHIYTHWDYVLERRSPDPGGWPWNTYRGSFMQGRDSCPQSLDWLGRTVSIPISQVYTDDDVADLERGMAKVLG